MYFLICYDRNNGILVSMKSYSDDDKLVMNDERLRLEMKIFTENNNQDVVVLEADSEENLKKTHNRYFTNTAGLISP